MKKDNILTILAATIVKEYKIGYGYKVYLLGNKNIFGVGVTLREAIGDFVMDYWLNFKLAEEENKE
jgi:hypothetical protein